MITAIELTDSSTNTSIISIRVNPTSRFIFIIVFIYTTYDLLKVLHVPVTNISICTFTAFLAIST